MWQMAWVLSTGSSLHNESMFRNGQRDGNTGLLELVTMQSRYAECPMNLETEDYGLPVRGWLDQQFQGLWKGRRGS
jgi:hypothetical protein